jgi:hypothetical protein
MSESNEFSDDLVDDESSETTESSVVDDEDDDDVAVRTVLLTKNDMLALLGLRTSSRGGLIVRIDPRQPLPAAQNYNDPESAHKWFNRSLGTSKRNGWVVLHDGEPMFG